MTAEELNTVKKYFNKHLEKSIIHSNFLSATALIFLTRKSDSNLRFCVNYQALNTITIKNHYFILFIKKTLNQLYKIKIYIKFNIIVTFNQIHIKKIMNE